MAVMIRMISGDLSTPAIFIRLVTVSGKEVYYNLPLVGTTPLSALCVTYMSVMLGLKIKGLDTCYSSP